MTRSLSRLVMVVVEDGDVEGVGTFLYFVVCSVVKLVLWYPDDTDVLVVG